MWTIPVEEWAYPVPVSPEEWVLYVHRPTDEAVRQYLEWVQTL